MNKVIKEQLDKVKFANLPPYDDDTTEMVINKKVFISSDDVKVDSTYIIEIESYVLFPNENFTLSTNWNHNTVPPSPVMNVSIVKKMGKMTYVKGFAYDVKLKKNQPLAWEGWLPNKSFKVV